MATGTVAHCWECDHSRSTFGTWNSPMGTAKGFLLQSLNSNDGSGPVLGGCSCFAKDCQSIVVAKARLQFTSLI